MAFGTNELNLVSDQRLVKGESLGPQSYLSQLGPLFRLVEPFLPISSKRGSCRKNLKGPQKLFKL